MISTLLHHVETRMILATSVARESENAVCRAIHHHLGAGGGRVRARFCLHASLQLGLGMSDAVTLATTCELLHNASLIQDDLIDRASPRRGIPSVWAAFDDATAICAGDLLLSSAFACAAELEKAHLLPAVMKLIGTRTRDVVLGQVAERGAAPSSLAEYEVLALGKSAALLMLPIELPLLMIDGKEHLKLAQRAAEAFAVAYQMADDLEDYDQDLEAGSLNAVSVALSCGEQTVLAARSAICERASKLLAEAIRLSIALPFDCAGILRSHAQQMLSAFTKEDRLRPERERVMQYAGLESLSSVQV